ncbi:MAG: acyl-CoA dehydrogenase family protein, partial [Leucobacter sp.]
MGDREARHRRLAEEYLPDELLERFRERAALVDRENRFADEDLAELRDRGYLRLFVPEELGGPGLTLHEVSRLQQRLAGAAPPTALAINMHLTCTGVVRAMLERGDRSLDYVLEEAMAGEIFAFGISEPANDWVLQGSNTVAEPQEDGGYLLSGVKIFTSLSPVWTRLIAHGLDLSDPEQPTLVFGFIDRGAPGISVADRWDVLGMRGSQSR